MQTRPIENDHTKANITGMLYSSYNHSGKIGLHTCKGWEFPLCQLKQDWRFWLICQADFDIRKENNIIEKCPVRPFCLFSLPHLLPRFKRSYQISWAPVLKMMESFPDISEINSDFQNISNDFVDRGRESKIRTCNALQPAAQGEEKIFQST